jgi:hypothetical protein
VRRTAELPRRTPNRATRGRGPLSAARPRSGPESYILPLAVNP